MATPRRPAASGGLKIRADQQTTLGAGERRVFEQRAIQGLADSAPTKGAPGDEDLGSLVSSGVDRARTHGVVREREVFKYIGVMRQFGPDFDQDPAQPWAGEILSARQRHATLSKGDYLFETAQQRAPTGELAETASVAKRFGDAEVGGTVTPCRRDTPPLPEAGAHWIELELVGEDDAPYVGERYRVVLDDGRTFEGVLGKEGLVRIDGLGATPCRIEFPDLDEAAWRAID